MGVSRRISGSAGRRWRPGPGQRQPVGLRHSVDWGAIRGLRSGAGCGATGARDRGHAGRADLAGYGASGVGSRSRGRRAWLDTVTYRFTSTWDC